MPDLSVDLAPRNPRELVLRNPVIPASGCFGGTSGMAAPPCPV